MPDFFATELEAARALATVRRLGSRAAAVVHDALDDAGAYHTRVMKQRFVQYGKGDPIQSRSGKLRNSFKWAVRGVKLEEKELRVFSTGGMVAHVQEYGATIRPKNKDYLTIPTRSALTAGGALKGGVRLRRVGNHYETEDGERTFIITAKSGVGYVAVQRGNKLVALYRLTKRVVLKPRLGFRKTWDEQSEPFLIKQLDLAAIKAVRS